MTVLDHTSSEVFERYYNQAKMIDAVKAYQESCLPIRRVEEEENDPGRHLRSLFVRQSERRLD